MGLSKINKIVKEFSAGESGETFIVSIDPITLGMPGGELIPSDGNRDLACLVEVVVIKIGGTNTQEGAKRLTVSFVIKDNSVAVEPTFPQDTEDFIINDNIFSLGISNGLIGPGAVLDNINISITHGGGTGNSKYKLFATIYAFGDNTL